MKFISLIAFLSSFCFLGLSYSQEANLKIKLLTHEGNVHANISIKVKSESTGLVYLTKSNAEGIAIIKVPMNDKYAIEPADYSRNHMISLPNKPIYYTATITYALNDLANAKNFEPNAEEIIALEKHAKNQKSVNILIGKSVDFKTKDKYNCQFTLTINDLYGKPLPNEEVVVAGETYKKVYINKTDKDGNCRFKLPKGELYHIHFQQDSFYNKFRIKASTGYAKQSKGIRYIGTVELERRAELKAIRVAEELIRTKREAKKYAEWLVKHKDDALKERKKLIKKFLDNEGFRNPLISRIFTRNKWKNKLIVADVTGSMHPYTKQLQAWFMLNHMKEKDLQFVFFNDGDGESDSHKKIGETGEIYCFPAKGVDTMLLDVLKVTRAGGGGDVEENNIEALLYGMKHSQKKFKDVIMIADNNAPIKDKVLANKIKRPIHIILCGVQREIEEDYLNLAYKTSGSIHTIEEDIINLSKLADGKTITINGLEYRLLNGKFYSLLKT